VVYQTIDQSRGHGLIEKDIHPPAELQVGGDDHAALLVAGRDIVPGFDDETKPGWEKGIDIRVQKIDEVSGCLEPYF